jgi:hypothetical protein
MSSVSIPTQGLTLFIPKGWEQVPASTLDQVTAKLRQRAPNTKVNRPLAAFQKPPLVPGELIHPYIVVSILPSRPLTKDDLRRMAEHTPSQPIAVKVKGGSSEFVTAATPSFSFDESALRLRGTFISTIGGVRVTNYVEIIPTKKGAITLNGYLLGKTTAAAQQFYGPMFAAAQLDAAHAYYPPDKNQSMNQPIDWSKWIVAAVFGALIGAVLVRKKKPK